MRTFFLILCCVLWCSLLYGNDAAFETLKSDHFIVRYRCDTQFAEQVRERAEQYYETIAADLDMDRFSGFWTWENRCTIVLFASREDYMQQTGQQQWAGGHVDYAKKIIFCYPWAEGFMTTLLPHELTHIILREYIKDNRHVPLWVDEGLAQFEEQSPALEQYQLMRTIAKNGSSIPFAEIQRIDSLAHGVDTEFAALFYAQSRSMITFLIDRYGRQRFGEFMRQLRLGKSIGEALRFAYSAYFESMQDFEHAWVNSIQD